MVVYDWRTCNRVSTDNGATFGAVLNLSANGTLGETAEEGPEEGE
jgi:hypothetical protein